MSSNPTTADAGIPPQFQFRLGDYLLLLPAAAVEAVTSFERPVPLPRVPPHVLGLLTYDQRALVILDLGRFLALPDDDVQRRARTLVVAAGEYRVGIPVDQALGVIEPRAASVRAGAHVYGGRVGEFVRGEVDTGAGLAALLDVDMLLEAGRA